MKFEKNIKVYSDGGARGNPGPGAAAFIVIRKGKVIYSQSKFLGKITNNIAEYTGVIMALSWLAENLKEESKENIYFYLDSELVVNQLSGKYKIKSDNLKPLIAKVRKLEKKSLCKIFYHSVPRSKNKLADHLVNKILDEKLK